MPQVRHRRIPYLSRPVSPTCPTGPTCPICPIPLHIASNSFLPPHFALCFLIFDFPFPHPPSKARFTRLPRGTGFQPVLVAWASLPMFCVAWASLPMFCLAYDSRSMPTFQAGRPSAIPRLPCSSLSADFLRSDYLAPTAFKMIPEYRLNPLSAQNIDAEQPFHPYPQRPYQGVRISPHTQFVQYAHA